MFVFIQVEKLSEIAKNMLYTQILENDWLSEKPQKLLLKRVKE